MAGEMASVRRAYGVPAYRGREVLFTGLKLPILARIISSTGSHLYLRDGNGRRVGPCHPTWAMDYRDGRDYSAEYDARLSAWTARINGAVPREKDADARSTATACGRMDPKRLQRIIDGKQRITKDDAARLHAGTGISARLWLNLERRYRADLAAGKKDTTHD